MTSGGPDPDVVAALLAERHGEPVAGLELLHGGFWSSAFGYRVQDRELVVRFGEIAEGFEMDRMAMAFSGPDLPVPDVIEIGQAFGGSYAISVRHHGRFLETVAPDEAPVAGPALQRLLHALRSVTVEPPAPASWYPPGLSPRQSTWRRWLSDGLVDDPGRQVNGWREVLAADVELDVLFRACEGRVHDLLDACPERRDLVHGDLLHRNVLVAEDASRVTAVFSWKCSVRGDFLFDVAWCTFWGAWHPGIAAMALWERTVGSPSVPAEALVDAQLRHHCYEVQIGATHLAWNAWTGNEEDLRSVAAHTARVLEEGPRSLR